MSSTVIINIKCDVYLIRFLEKVFGEMPIAFPKNHDFNHLLHFLLDVCPLNYKETDFGESTLKVQLPYFEDKNVKSYIFLSERRQRIFTERVWEYFKISFRGEINKSILLGLNRNTGIELFMEKYNIPVDCLDMLEKDYHRYLKVRWKQKLFRPGKILSVKEAVCPVV